MNRLSHNQKNLYGISIIVFLVWATFSVESVRGQGNKPIIPLLRKLTTEFAEDALTVRKLEKRFNTKAEQATNKNYWSLDVSQYGLRMTLNAYGKNESLKTLEIYTSDLTQLSLADLENLYGKTTATVSSKTSWVTFNDEIAPGMGRLHISAHLYSSQIEKDSPVLAVLLRKQP